MNSPYIKSLENEFDINEEPVETIEEETQENEEPVETIEEETQENEEPVETIEETHEETQETTIDYTQELVMIENLSFIQVSLLGALVFYFVLSLVVKFIKSFF